MIAVLNAAGPVFGLVLLGWVVAKRGILGVDATKALNDFVVWLALPAVLFQSTAQITVAELDQPGFAAALALGMAVIYAAAFVLERRPGHRLADRSIEGLGACYPNTGFMGIPLCLIALGPASLPPAIIATLITTCVLFAAAIAMIETDLQAQADWRRTAGTVGRALARNPLVAAPLLGFAWAATGVALPPVAVRFVSLLGGAASPCALVTIGLFLAQTRPGTASGPVVRRLQVSKLLALKLLVQPAVTAALAYGVFAMPPLWARCAVLLSALPTGTGPFMLAALYGRDAAVTSRLILLSTVFSVVTVSVLLAVLS